MLKKLVVDNFMNDEINPYQQQAQSYLEKYVSMCYMKKTENFLRYFFMYIIVETDDPMESLQYNVGYFQESIESIKYLGLTAGFSEKMMRSITCWVSTPS